MTLQLKNAGLKGTDAVVTERRGDRTARPGNVDVARRSISLNITSRGIREACDVVVHRHCWLVRQVARWQPLIDNIVRRTNRHLVADTERRRGVSRKRVLLKNDRTAGTTGVVLV